MHAAVEFARPFRMPDFFLISGLFLARVIDRDWRDYLDKKVLHFAYFYVLWVTIQFAFKAPMFAAEHGLARRRPGLSRSLHRAVRHAVVHLPAADLLRRRSKLDARRCRGWRSGSSAPRWRSPHVDTGWTVIDEFAHRFVYFYTGYVFASHVFALAARVQRSRARRWPGSRSGRSSTARWCSPAIADLPFVSLALGLAGAARGGRGRGADGAERPVPAAALLRPELDRHLSRLLPADGGDPHRAAQDRHRRRPRHDLAAGDRRRRRRRAVLVWAVRDTPLRFLFERPAWARLQARARRRLAAGGMIHSVAWPALI